MGTSQSVGRLEGLWQEGLRSFLPSLGKWDGKGPDHPWPEKWAKCFDLILEWAEPLYRLKNDKTRIVPTPEERAWWLDKNRELPWLRVAAGAFCANHKKGGKVVRVQPFGLQEIMVRHAIACWIKKIRCEQCVLKGRQSYISTIGLAMACSFAMGVPSSATEVIPHLAKNATKMLKRQCMMLLELPEWDRPVDEKTGKLKRENDDETQIHCESMGVTNVQMDADSAEKREKIGRGVAYHLLHRTEKPYWPEPELVDGAIEDCLSEGDGCYVLDESTGVSAYDGHGKLYLAMSKEPVMGQAAFFWGTHQHPDNVLPLEHGETRESILAEVRDASEEVARRMEQFECSDEFCKWYWIRYQKAAQKGPTALQIFLRDQPFTPEDALKSGSNGLFDSERLDAELKRCREFKPGSMETLTKQRTSIPINRPEKGKFLRVMRGSLMTDFDNDFRDPRVQENQFSGTWSFVELPKRHGGRVNQTHVVVVDVASGGIDAKRRPTGDQTAIRVIRTSYEPGIELCAHIDVAWFAGAMSVPEAARCANALSILYPGEGGKKAPVIWEVNHEGHYFMEHAKRMDMELYMPSKIGGVTEETQIKYGLHITPGLLGEGSKRTLVGYFVEDWHACRIMTNDPLTLEAFKSFGKDEKGGYKGLGGAPDDRVSTMWLGVENIKFSRSVTGPNLPSPIARPEPTKEGEEARAAELSAEEKQKLVDKWWAEQIGNGSAQPVGGRSFFKDAKAA